MSQVRIAIVFATIVIFEGVRELSVYFKTKEIKKTGNWKEKEEKRQEEEKVTQLKYKGKELL